MSVKAKAKISRNNFKKKMFLKTQRNEKKPLLQKKTLYIPTTEKESLTKQE